MFVVLLDFGICLLICLRLCFVGLCVFASCFLFVVGVLGLCSNCFDCGLLYVDLTYCVSGLTVLVWICW